LVFTAAQKPYRESYRVLRRANGLLEKAAAMRGTTEFFGAIFMVSLSCLSGVAPAKAQQSDLVSACAPCHSADGIARDGEVPNLAGQNEPYLLNQLHAFHEGRRVHKEMRLMSRNLTEDEMRAIAAYYSSLPPR
jgi:cytochrome c553